MNLCGWVGEGGRAGAVGELWEWIGGGARFIDTCHLCRRRGSLRFQNFFFWKDDFKISSREFWGETKFFQMFFFLKRWQLVFWVEASGIRRRLHFSSHTWSALHIVTDMWRLHVIIRCSDRHKHIWETWDVCPRVDPKANPIERFYDDISKRAMCGL